MVANLLTQLSTRQPLTLAGGKVKVVPAPNGYHLHTPYHADFVADLKAQIHPHARRYDKATKVWWVSEPYLTAAVLDILATWFDAELGRGLERIRAAGKPAIELIAEVY